MEPFSRCFACKQTKFTVNPYSSFLEPEVEQLLNINAVSATETPDRSSSQQCSVCVCMCTCVTRWRKADLQSRSEDIV